MSLGVSDIILGVYYTYFTKGMLALDQVEIGRQCSSVLPSLDLLEAADQQHRKCRTPSTDRYIPRSIASDALNSLLHTLYRSFHGVSQARDWLYWLWWNPRNNPLTERRLTYWRSFQRLRESLCETLLCFTLKVPFSLMGTFCFPPWKRGKPPMGEQFVIYFLPHWSLWVCPHWTTRKSFQFAKFDSFRDFLKLNWKIPAIQ